MDNNNKIENDNKSEELITPATAESAENPAKRRLPKFVLIGTISASLIVLVLVILFIILKPKQVLPFSLGCEDNYSLKGELCISKTAIEQKEKFCRQGKLENNLCVFSEEKPVEKSCPNNTKEQDAACVQVISKVGTTSQKCPDNWTLKGSRCFSNQTVEAKFANCPAGTKKVVDRADKRLCFQKQRSIGHPQYDSCHGANDDDHINEQSTCYYEPIIITNLICADSFVLEGKKCRQQQASTNSVSCEAGYQLDGNNCKLTRKIAKQISCPAEFSLEGEKCIKKTTSPVEMIESCSGTGLIKIGDKCYQQKAAVKACPNNYRLENGRCLLQK